MLYSVIVPVYNEYDNIENCISTLSSFLESKAESYGFRFEIIVYDDGSTDNTRQKAEEFTKDIHLNFGDIRIDGSEINKGKGAAVRQGMLISKGDFCIFTDCDIAYGCESIYKILSCLSAPENNYDILIGSRAISENGYNGYGFIRKLASKTYLKILSVFAGFSHTDSQCGIKAFKGKVARNLFGLCEVDRWAFDLEVLLIADKACLNIGEYPVSVINHGDSKVNVARDSIKMLRDLKKIKNRVRDLDVSSLMNGGGGL